MTNIELDALNKLQLNIDTLKSHSIQVGKAMGKLSNDKDRFDNMIVNHSGNSDRGSIELKKEFYNWSEFLMLYKMRVDKEIEKLEKQFAGYPIKGELNKSKELEGEDTE